MWSPSCILEQRGFQPAIVCKTRVLLIASATVRFIGVAILWGFRSPARPPGSFDGPEGRRGSFFSFNRTSGSCWRCKPVCRVKASIPGAIWATPAAPRSRTPTPPAPPAEIRFIGHTAWRRRCDRHSPRGVFFDGTVLFPAELPAIDCRRTADMASRPRSSARLPCADGAPPYAAASILVNDCGASLPPTEIITGALIDPILTRWGASERLPRAENQCAVRLQLMSGLVRIADSRQTSREVRRVCARRLRDCTVPCPACRDWPGTSRRSEAGHGQLGSAGGV